MVETCCWLVLKRPERGPCWAELKSLKCRGRECREGWKGSGEWIFWRGYTWVEDPPKVTLWGRPGIGKFNSGSPLLTMRDGKGSDWTESVASLLIATWTSILSSIFEPNLRTNANRLFQNCPYSLPSKTVNPWMTDSMSFMLHYTMRHRTGDQ